MPISNEEKEKRALALTFVQDVSEDVEEFLTNDHNASALFEHYVEWLRWCEYMDKFAMDYDLENISAEQVIELGDCDGNREVFCYENLDEFLSGENF